MDVKIESSWKEALKDEFEKSYFHELTSFVKSEYQNGICYPPSGKIFSAFQHCPLPQVKVVILGQDPYHGPGQANGLCFSVNDGVRVPPSLVNIFKEINRDLAKPIPSSGNLERWADQGVLLLNATLTVRAHTAGSHQNKGWEKFTDAVVNAVNEQSENVVFMLWGNYAKKKGNLIKEDKHLVLHSAHPSPLSAYQGFLGNAHFSKANHYLKSVGKEGIVW
jgi:uracil-DNA glycosylase